MRRHGRLGAIFLGGLELLLFLCCTDASQSIVAGPGPYFLDNKERVRGGLSAERQCEFG